MMRVDRSHMSQGRYVATMCALNQLAAIRESPHQITVCVHVARPNSMVQRTNYSYEINMILPILVLLNLLL